MTRSTTMLNCSLFTSPSQITESVLNDFYTHIPGKHNYKVKLHTKLKGFIKYLDEARRLPVDPSYKLSSFTEEYDNQCPEDDDIALPVDAVLKLFELRKKLQTGEVQIQKFAKSDKISVGLQDHLDYSPTTSAWREPGI